MTDRILSVALLLSFIFAVSFTVSYGWELGFQAAVAGKVVG